MIKYIYDRIYYPLKKGMLTTSIPLAITGASLKIRTPGLLVRSQTLYPAELTALIA